MSDRTPASPALTLPDHPNLDHLKGQARRRLRVMRETSPEAKLAEAQLQIAREYGFSSWRQLKAFVEMQSAPDERYRNLVGFYAADPAVMTNGVAAVSAVGGRLMLDAINGSRFELADRGEGRFAIAGLDGGYRFEGAEAGPARALIMQTRSGQARLARIDAVEAAALREARERAEAEQLRPRKAVSVPPHLLERYVGHYASPLGPALEVTCDDGRLLVQVAGQPRLEVFPESETSFFYRAVPAQLSFVLEHGRAVRAVVHQNGAGQPLERVSAEAAAQSSAEIQARLAEQQRPRAVAAIDPAILPRYAGRYRLDATRVMIISVENERPFAELTGQPRFEIYPESEDTFFWTVVAAQVTFVAGAEGRVTHAVLHQNGRDLPLPRIEPQLVPA